MVFTLIAGFAFTAATTINAGNSPCKMRPSQSERERLREAHQQLQAFGRALEERAAEQERVAGELLQAYEAFARAPRAPQLGGTGETEETKEDV